jgi:hypothetical protein
MAEECPHAQRDRRKGEERGEEANDRNEEPEGNVVLRLVEPLLDLQNGEINAEVNPFPKVLEQPLRVGRNPPHFAALRCVRQGALGVRGR